MFSKPRSLPETVTAGSGANAVEVKVRVNERARSYRLTISGAGRAVLTVPKNGKWSEAERFLSKHTAWLEARMRRAPQNVPFAEGALIPLRGDVHLLRGSGKLRGHVEIAEGAQPELIVPGGAEHMARRLTDWLKAEALKDLEPAVARHAGTLGVTALSVRVREQSSRWGSCASSGRLNFNWRLIMAPPFALDYVAAHEVAHLVEMNHSGAFWAQVEKALPDMERGRSWLKVHGRELMAYGAMS